MSRIPLIFALLLAAALPLFAADPSEQFLKAYQNYQQGENLERSGNTSDAVNKYHFAESLLIAISKNDPSWQKPVVEYRLKKTRESLDRLQSGSSGSGGENVLSAPADAMEKTSPDLPPPERKRGPSITIVPPGTSRESSQGPGEVEPASSGETKRLRRMIEDLKGQLQESREALDTQKRRANDLENAEWVKKRSELINELDVAKRKISDLEHDLKSRDSWGRDLKGLQQKLDDSVADKLAAEEQFQSNIKKVSEENASLVKQLQEAKSKVVAGIDSTQKMEQLTQEVEKGKEAFQQLQARLDHSDQVAKESLARNGDLQKQLAETSERLIGAQKQLDQAAPLRDKIKQLQAKVDEGAAAVVLKSSLEADIQVLQEDRDRLVQKVNLLGEAAKEATKVSGLRQETETLKKNVADLKGRLESGEKELAKARAVSEASAKAADVARAQAEKTVDATLADKAVLEEERKRLLSKLDQSANAIGALRKDAAAAQSLTRQVNALKSELEANARILAQSAAKVAEAEHATAALGDKAQQKDQASRSLSDLLTQQNIALQEQLKSALGQISSAADHTPEAAVLQEQVKKLQEQITQNARNYSESQQQLTDLIKARPDQEKILNEKEKALADAQAEASRLRSQLSDAAQQMANLKKQGDEGESHLKQLQDQLADRDEKIARYKNKKGNAAEEQMAQENNLLRGIVLREIKDEAKKAQARRLMEEELKRLNIQSDALQHQMSLLTAPALELTPQERGLFKDAQLIVTDEAGAKLQASISAPAGSVITTHDTMTNANAAPRVPPLNSNIQAPSKDVQQSSPRAENKPDQNAPPQVEGDAWQGKFKDLLAQAKEEFDRQDYIQAENTFQEALKLSPNDYFALSNLGVVQFQLGKMKEAEESLKKASAQSSDSSFALTTLGIVHYRQERLPDAEKVLRKAVAINEQDFTAHNYLGIVLAASGKGKAGESEIMKAIEINPKYADAHFNLAVIYATGKPPAKMMAKKHYTKALELGSPPDASLEHLIQ